MRVVITQRRRVPTTFKSAFVGVKQISYIKNRDKIVSASDRQKSQETFNRLEKFAKNEYEESLWFFECHDA